jgi:hypothetical protein
MRNEGPCKQGSQNKGTGDAVSHRQEGYLRSGGILYPMELRVPDRAPPVDDASDDRDNLPMDTTPTRRWLWPQEGPAFGCG